MQRSEDAASPGKASRSYTLDRLTDLITGTATDATAEELADAEAWSRRIFNFVAGVRSPLPDRLRQTRLIVPGRLPAAQLARSHRRGSSRAQRPVSRAARRAVRASEAPPRPGGDDPSPLARSRPWAAPQHGPIAVAA
jgi:hypothetical protein